MQNQNQNQIQRAKKMFRDNNKECKCGSIVLQCNYKKHTRSTKHLNFIKKLREETALRRELETLVKYPNEKQIIEGDPNAKWEITYTKRHGYQQAQIFENFENAKKIFDNYDKILNNLGDWWNITLKPIN